jgi:branched-chain amino acid transport system ATP-binding protein
VLRLRHVDVRIAGVHVLRDVSFALAPGTTTALIGRNGAGKTTTLRTIMGFMPPAGGELLFGEVALDGVKPHRRPGLGIGYAPEDRRLFTGLSVEDNLLLPARVAKRPADEGRRRLELIYDILPELAELRDRPAGAVSGGQGKMVALGRALMIGTKLVLLDEPFQGLAPALASRYAGALRRLGAIEPGITLLITESNPLLVEALADATLTIERGEVSETIPPRAPTTGSG